MARSWAEFLGEDGAGPESEEERRGLFGRLRESLGKSRRALTEQLAAAAFDPGDETAWERLEEALIAGDVGVRATAELVQRLEARGDISDLNQALADETDGVHFLGRLGTYKYYNMDQCVGQALAYYRKVLLTGEAELATSA